MPRRSKWTEEEWDKMARIIKELYQGPDETHRTIAKLMKCSEQTVRNILYGFRPTFFKHDKTKKYGGRR